MASLRLILADQLTESLASLRDCDMEQDWILMAEVRTEATYVKHHKKKIAFLFSAMRHFAQSLNAQGYQVKYVCYQDRDNPGSLLGAVKNACQSLPVDNLVLTEPGEYRVLKDMQNWSNVIGLPVEMRTDDRFLVSTDEFAQWASGRKELRMEYFYRPMRKRFSILMQEDKPIGGKWNFDSANRKALPKSVSVPAKTAFVPDEITNQVLSLVQQEFGSHFGSLDNFDFAVTREQALQVLGVFIQDRLRQFGDYQDAMAQDQPWLFHSHISFYLNAGLLLPREVIDVAEQAYHAGLAPLNAVEGFVRQVLGWREYVRGLYWLKMPEYAQANYLNAQRPLPDFFWTADTQMNCLQQCISDTYNHAYAHHIQRLMVIGNFALLAGLSPEQVNEWYLLVYADAYEWVEMPNVTGMILFADGGVLASKPYAASGAYIHKMSNYCEHCHYNVKEKIGAQACPFNYLYWHFLQRNQDKLAKNPRLGMPYRTLKNMEPAKLAQIEQDSLIFLASLDN